MINRKAREIILKALKEGRKHLLETEAKELISLYGINVLKFKLARNLREAVKFSAEIGFPVVLKIVSPDILHKSDVGGVFIDLSSSEDVKKAYRFIIRNIKRDCPGANIIGVLVEKMAKPGVEVIIGSLKDPQFGPTIMFGLGGVFVEILKDVSYRIAPLTRLDAMEMLKEIKGYKILRGYRNIKPRDERTLINFILSVSRLVVENEEIQQLDLNPVVVYEKGAVVLDAKVVLESKG